MYKVKILEQMTYMHMKSHKNLQKTSENIMISMKYRKTICIFSKKSNEYHIKHQEITYTHMK